MSDKETGAGTPTPDRFIEDHQLPGFDEEAGTPTLREREMVDRVHAVLRNAIPEDECGLTARRVVRALLAAPSPVEPRTEGEG